MWNRQIRTAFARTLAAALFTGASAAALHAQALAPARTGETSPPAERPGIETVFTANPMYRIGPGDLLALKFGYNAELDDRVVVRSDGMVTLRLVGDVPAGGRTPAELSADVSRLYETHLRKPNVSIAVEKSANLLVFVGGEVTNPRALPLDGRLTAWQAVLSAGGPRSSAKLKEAIWIRKLGPEQAVVRVLDLKAISRGEEPDPQLQAFDVLHVPRSKIGVANLAVEQYVNGIIPRALFFPYNMNTNFKVE